MIDWKLTLLAKIMESDSRATIEVESIMDDLVSIRIFDNSSDAGELLLQIKTWELRDFARRLLAMTTEENERG